jgi:hypothetical protein
MKENPCLSVGGSSSGGVSGSQGSKHTGGGRKNCKYRPLKGSNCISNNDPYAYYNNAGDYEDRCCIASNKGSVTVKIQKDWITKTPDNKKITYTGKNPFTKIEESSKP